MEEKTKDFKETFIRAKETGSSYIVLEEVCHNELDKTIKPLIVCDSSYLN